MSIFRVHISEVMLVEADTQKDAEWIVESYQLAEKSGEGLTGKFISVGLPSSSLTVIPPHFVKYELSQMGNDGHFFDKEDINHAT